MQQEYLGGQDKNGDETSWLLARFHGRNTGGCDYVV